MEGRNYGNGKTDRTISKRLPATLAYFSGTSVLPEHINAFSS